MYKLEVKMLRAAERLHQQHISLLGSYELFFLPFLPFFK